MSLPRARVRRGHTGRQVFQVALHDRLQVSVDDDGGGALVFAEFGKDLVGDREWDGEALERRGDG